jgi:serine/threonine protein kinase
MNLPNGHQLVRDFTLKVKCTMKNGVYYCTKIIESSNSDAFNSLKTKVELVATLRNTNLIKYLECLQLDNRIYLVLEYAGERSCSLEQFIQSNNIESLDLDLVLRDVASALQDLHHLNIMHGNLNALNILITSNYRAKVSGFGLNEFRAGQARKPVDLKSLEWTLLAPECAGLRASLVS